MSIVTIASLEVTPDLNGPWSAALTDRYPWTARGPGRRRQPSTGPLTAMSWPGGALGAAVAMPSAHAADAGAGPVGSIRLLGMRSWRRPRVWLRRRHTRA